LQKFIAISGKIKQGKQGTKCTRLGPSQMNYGDTEISSPNASNLLFCEFSFVSVLVLAKRKLQDDEV
jgi:hypothetical protein